MVGTATTPEAERERRRKIADAKRGVPRPHMQGDRHPNWTGGASQYRGPGSATVHAAARERDDYRCQWCGRSGYVVAHHVKPWQQGGTTTGDNLLTLCQSCHQKAHATQFQRRCVVCERPFEAGKPRALYCSTHCKDVQRWARHKAAGAGNLRQRNAERAG